MGPHRVKAFGQTADVQRDSRALGGLLQQLTPLCVNYLHPRHTATALHPHLSLCRIGQQVQDLCTRTVRAVNRLPADKDGGERRVLRDDESAWVVLSLVEANLRRTYDELSTEAGEREASPF